MDKCINATTTAENLQHAKLPCHAQNDVHGANRFCKHFDLFPFIAFGFLTYNAIMSIYRSRGNPWDLAFVISCYVELTLLFFCMKMRENLGADATAEHVHWLKIVVFILTTLLTVTFAYRVSLIMPFLLKLVVWGMSGSVVVAGFYAFFIFDRDVKGANGYCKLDDRSPEQRV
jgi:Family of unknown function (DUF6490)